MNGFKKRYRSKILIFFGICFATIFLVYYTRYSLPTITGDSVFSGIRQILAWEKTKATILLCVATMSSVVNIRFRSQNSSLGFTGLKTLHEIPQSKILELPQIQSVYNKEWAKDRSNLTVVTAFFNLGTFVKGGARRRPNTYFQWLKIFSKIQNPVIGYTDDPEFLEEFKKHRNKGSESHLVLINRTDLYSFSLEAEIDQVYRHFLYPGYQPNTVLAAYSCAMHAKYELLAKSVAENLFSTYYFMWLDIGYFRDTNVAKQKQFKMVAPKMFQEKTHFMMAKVADLSPSHSVIKIVFRNLVSPSGASSLGTIETWPVFWDQYKRTIHCMLHRNLMSTDQQMIYAMFTNQLEPCVQPKVLLQMSGTGWFQLGHMMKQE